MTKANAKTLNRIRELCLALRETSERLSHGARTFFVELGASSRTDDLDSRGRPNSADAPSAEVRPPRALDDDVGGPPPARPSHEANR